MVTKDESDFHTCAGREGWHLAKLNDDMDHPESWVRSAASFEASKPLYVWKLLVEWLKSSKPVGPLMLTHINKALNRLGTNVLEAIPRGHGLSKTQLEAMRRRELWEPRRKRMDSF